MRRLSPEDAYCLWAESYDAEPDNVVLALEQRIFSTLLSDIPIADKVVVDIGCGTGRHWSELLLGRPRLLHGVDSSKEMLEQLRRRHPEASLHRRAASKIGQFADASVDVVVSTLMLGHVRDVEAELKEWARLLTTGGEILVTDFHPRAFGAGMKRTFRHDHATFEVEHHLHTLEAIRSLLQAMHLTIVRVSEGAIDASVRGSFERSHYEPMYRKNVGTPLVLGLRIRRGP